MPILSNARHEKFAQACARGMSETAAWLAVNPNATPQSAAVTANRTLKNANVVARIAELQAPALAEVGLTLAYWLEHVKAEIENPKGQRAAALKLAADYLGIGKAMEGAGDEQPPSQADVAAAQANIRRMNAVRVANG